MTDYKEMVFKIICNIYGFKDAGKHDGFDTMRLVPTKIDAYIFIRGTYTIILYNNDCIVISCNKIDDNI